MGNMNMVKGKIVEKGYNLERFAEKIGITRKTLGKTLAGKRDFTASEILKICDVLAIEHSDIGTYFFTE